MRTRIAVLSFCLLSVRAYAVSVWLGGYDLHRSNSNVAETVLTRSLVGSASFGAIGSYAVDGAVYAQPLIIENVGGRTIAVIATMHDSVYAFDANDPSAGTNYLWQVSLATSRTVDPSNPSFHEFPNGEIGCLATPVVDTVAQIVYAECLDSSNVHKLYSLNLADGSTYHAPVTISATASGVAFSSSQQKNRAGLLLLNGEVYTAFASTGNDIAPFHGWVMGYNAATLSQDYVWCSTCANGGAGAGIWMSGGGIAADSSNNLYLVTGNGDWDGTGDYGESFVKLNSSLVVQDFFTPTNWATLNSGDSDLGTGRALLIDDSHLFGIGKNGNAWVLSAANMGHLQSGGVGPSQVFAPSGANNNRNQYTFANGVLYLGLGGVSSFAWSGSALNTTPTATSSVASGYGYALAYSSNGASDGIVWITSTASSAFSSLQPGVLHALNGTTLAEIWNSGTTLGNIAKFVPPTIANGKVYSATFSNQIVVYGKILNQTQMRGRVGIQGLVGVQ